MFKEADHRSKEVGAILSHDLGIDAITESVEGTTSASNDGDVLLVGTTLRGSLEVLQNCVDNLLMVGRHLIGHLLGQVNQTNQRSVANLIIRVEEKSNNCGKKLLELSGDKIWCTLS